MACHPKMIDLRPNTNLLNSNFNGYKLFLSPVSTITENFDTPVDYLVPNTQQYSLLHAKLFILQNHLYGEQTHPESVYFINKSWSIEKYTIDDEAQQFEVETLWNIPDQENRTSESYNTSMHLTDDKISVVSDGNGAIYILDRGERKNSDQWSVVHSQKVGFSFIIIDSLLKHEGNELNVLLTSIIEKENTGKHCTLLHWYLFKQNGNQWIQNGVRSLEVNGFVQYANFERQNDAIYVISDSGCRFIFDSEKEIENFDEKQLVNKTFSWSQTKEDIIIKFPVPENSNTYLFDVATKNETILVKKGEATILQGQLYGRIDHKLTSQSVDDNCLQIKLRKAEFGTNWPEFVLGNENGDYVSGADAVKIATEQLAQITSEKQEGAIMGATFNSQELEECDFEYDKNTIFERICLESHQTTNKINLGTNEVLLTVCSEMGENLAFGIKSDVDACIWQAKNNGDFVIEHVGTLLSLAYIKASKQQMKFFVCAPDLSYAAICDNKHLFIYSQNKAMGGNELRNRISGRRVNEIAQQQVFSLPQNEDIVGIYASNSYIYLLAEKSVTARKLS